MKKIKSLTAICLVIALMLSLAACHPKNEVAMTVTDKKADISVKVTTAQYLYTLTSATLEAQNNIKTANSEKTITDYAKYKVVETGDDGKETKTEYYKWIENRAEELVREYAGSMIKKKALKLKLDDGTQTNIDNYANMYWQYYYQATFEKNGIGSETYKKMYTASYFKNQYFLSIYDTDGTDAIPEKTVSTEFYKNYCLANTIKITVKTEASTDDSSSSASLTLDEAQKLLKDYKARLAKGESFETIYKEYNKQYNSSDSNTDASSTDGMPVVYGAAGTSYASDYFEDVKKLKTESTKILTNSDSTEVVLVEKQDISKDEDTYYKNYRSDVLNLLKGDEFNTNFEKYYDGLKIEKDKSATGRIKTKKIDVTSSAAATA